MKRFFGIILLLGLIISPVFSEKTINDELVAAEYDFDKQMFELKVYDLTETYSANKSTTVTVFYYPFYNEARIVYSCDYETFDDSDAVVSLKRCLEYVTKEFGYYHYIRTRPDSISYHKSTDGKKYASVTSYILFKE